MGAQDPAVLSAAFEEFTSRFVDAVHHFQSNLNSGGAQPGGSGGGSWQNMDPRNFRRWIESLQTVAYQTEGKAVRTLEETNRIYQEMIRRGWRLTRPGIETNWKGGRHIHMTDPSGNTVHFPVPPDFVIP